MLPYTRCGKKQKWVSKLTHSGWVLYELDVDEQDYLSLRNSEEYISEDDANLLEKLLLSNPEPREEPHVGTESRRDAALANNSASEDGLAQANFQVPDRSRKMALCLAPNGQRNQTWFH